MADRQQAWRGAPRNGMDPGRMLGCQGGDSLLARRKGCATVQHDWCAMIVSLMFLARISLLAVCVGSARLVAPCAAVQTVYQREGNTVTFAPTDARSIAADAYNQWRDTHEAKMRADK